LVDSDRDLDIARVVKDAQILLPALACRARLLLEAGRLEEAEKCVAELLVSSEKLPASWVIDFAVALRALDRGDNLPEWAARVQPGTPWLSAAVAFAAGDFLRAAEICAEIGSLPDEALARLYAAEQLIGESRRAEGDAELQRALAFYRSVGAKAYMARGEALLAASA
jgi:tetratricopeptide (TPR) repeat protein